MEILQNGYREQRSGLCIDGSTVHVEAVTNSVQTIHGLQLSKAGKKHFSFNIITRLVQQMIPGVPLSPIVLVQCRNTRSRFNSFNVSMVLMIKKQWHQMYNGTPSFSDNKLSFSFCTPRTSGTLYFIMLVQPSDSWR